MPLGENFRLVVLATSSEFRSPHLRLASVASQQPWRYPCTTCPTAKYGPLFDFSPRARKQKSMNSWLKCMGQTVWLSQWFTVGWKSEKEEKTFTTSSASLLDYTSIYIGQTKRQFLTRLLEHKNNIKKQQDFLSVVSLHIIQHSHDFKWDDVQILDYEPYYFKRLISESIYIKFNNFTINISTDTDLLSPAYYPLLDYKHFFIYQHYMSVLCISPFVHFVC